MLGKKLDLAFDFVLLGISNILCEFELKIHKRAGFKAVFFSKAGICFQDIFYGAGRLKTLWVRFGFNAVFNPDYFFVFVNPNYVYGKFHIFHPDGTNLRFIINKKHAVVFFELVFSGQAPCLFWRIIGKFNANNRFPDFNFLKSRLVFPAQKSKKPDYYDKNNKIF